MKKIPIIMLCFFILFTIVGCKAKDDINVIHKNSQNNDSTEQSETKPNDSSNEQREIKWYEISSDGLDEEKLIENIDEATLEDIAALLQELTDEIEAKQREDREFAMSAGWFTYTLESDKYKKVINMGNKAAKPLYLIIYKSPNQGLFEYICAMALNEITNCNNNDWKTSKEFLNIFNEYILEHQ